MEIRMESVNLDQVNRQDLQREIAALLGVLDSQVVILSVVPGSVIVSFKLVPVLGMSVLPAGVLNVTRAKCDAETIVLPSYGNATVQACDFPGEGGGSGSSTGMLVGVVVAALVICCLVGLAVRYFLFGQPPSCPSNCFRKFRKRRNDASASNSYYVGPEGTPAGAEGLSNQTQTPDPMRVGGSIGGSIGGSNPSPTTHTPLGGDPSLEVVHSNPIFYTQPPSANSTNPIARR